VRPAGPRPTMAIFGGSDMSRFAGLEVSLIEYIEH
jgi:hypothetical protein